MATNNSLRKADAQSFSTYTAMPAVRQKVNEIIGGKKGDGFITSIVTSVSNNPSLQKCDYNTILSAALLGASLNLSPSPQLGQFYMVPFNDNRNNRTVAQFQLGYKGYVQMAIRSGQYRNINVLSLKEGELIKWDELTETIEYQLMDDWEARENAETIGYYAYFELSNGFKKAMFWTKSRMNAHAKKYSQGYASDQRKGTAYTFWSKDFDGMAYKTMLRQLISKWGIMSIEMQSAIESDMAVVSQDGSPSYIDNDIEVAPTYDAEVVETLNEVNKTVQEPEAQQFDIETAFFGGGYER